jgi:hypothetical protein
MTDVAAGAVPWAALLVCLSLVSVAGAGSPATDSTPGDPLHGSVETDEISIEVRTGPDGDATWRIEYRTELGPDGNATDAFESLAADVRANPENYTDRFEDRIRGTVSDAQNTTDRSMTATDFGVETETSPIYGIVAYTFEWSNFANATGNRIVVGDAIGGFVMNADTRLQFRWSEGWGPTAIAPEPGTRSDQSVRWSGADTEFGPDQPRVVLEPVAGATPGPTTTESPSTDSPTTAAGTDPGGGGLPVGVLALLALVALAVIGVAWWGGPGDEGGVPTSGSGGDATVTGGTTGESGTATGGPEATAATGVADPDGETSDDSGDEDAIDEELLSNEERVLRVLEDNGGRAKQQEVVEALDWTEAKTSQVVSGMREEGTIDGFRLGRENVLTLPDEDLDPTDSGPDGDN